MVGPSYTYGALKKNFLDYKKISIYPELILKSGESPFVFANFNEDSRIKFVLGIKFMVLLYLVLRKSIILIPSQIIMALFRIR